MSSNSDADDILNEILEDSKKSVTIKARGKRITQAVDVSQFILKRMHSIGYSISDVRISSDALESKDGKTRNVSTIEIDISHN